MKLLTLNLANFNDHPNWNKRRKIISDKIKELNPDICLFQEIRYDKSLNEYNMLQEIAKDHESYYINYQIAQYYDNDYKPVNRFTDIWEGLGIMSKDSPDIIVTQYLKNSNYDLNNRINQIYQFNHLCLVNVHFSFDENTAIINAEDTINCVKLIEDNVILLAGDMNLDNTDIFDNLFIDCWKLIKGNEDGYTFPSDFENERIDYFWIDKKNKDLVKDIKLIFDKEIDGIYASDHCGLLIELY